MLNNKDIKENNVNIRTSKKKTLSLLFEFLFIILFILYFDEIKTTQEKFTVFIFAIAASILSVRLLWFIFGHTDILINNKYIQIRKTLLIQFSKKQYSLSKVSEIKKTHNQNKSTFWNFGGLVFFEKDPMIITFKNNFKNINIADITEEQADLIAKKLITR